MAFIVVRETVALGRTILEGNDGHWRVHRLWLIDRIRSATANQTDSLNFPMLFTHRGSPLAASRRSEEHTSELQSLMRISYAVFCLKKKRYPKQTTDTTKYLSLPNSDK